MRRVLAVLIIALFPTASSAWESKCYQHSDESLGTDAYATVPSVPCAPAAGPNVAHHRWIGPLDEHRQIWERTRVLAGLPASISRTIELREFTSSRTVQIGSYVNTSLVPVAFTDATTVQSRSLSIGELAQLPDFSYSLSDWANGNELCPLAGISTDAVDCHDFSTHMGPVNVNHFVPEAAVFYRRTHLLALARAGECRAMGAGLAASGTRFHDWWDACETEAMAIEAVAQHYLQDAWSMGHMWQRWGTPDLADAPGSGPQEQRSRALLVALAAGLIHGARGILQTLPDWTTYDVNDAMCAPSENVRFVLAGRIEHGLGDGYLSSMMPARSDGTAPPTYAFQYQRMMECATAGMLAVYQASGASHGAIDMNAPMSHATVDPLGPECWSQRATNQAMATGAGIQYRLLGVQSFIPMDARFVSWALPTVGTTSGRAELDPVLRSMYRVDLARAMSLLRIFARASPDGTEAADGGLGDVLGIHPNGSYTARTPIASYQDPELPWPATRDTSTPDASSRALALARLFHRAHAADWCTAVSHDDLIALRHHAREVRLEPTARAAACEICVEFSERHLRVGTEAHFDITKEPICHYLAANPAYLYQPPVASEQSDPHAPAREWCGCGAQ